MKKFHILILMIVSATACSEDAISVPDFSSHLPVLNLEEEASTIPWEFISGQIVYANHRTRDIVLINGDTKELSIIVKDKLGRLVWHPQENNFSGFNNTFPTWDIGFGKLDYLPDLITYDLQGKQIHPYYSNLVTGFAWSSDARLAYTGYDNHYAYIDNTLFTSEFYCNGSRPAWSPDNEYLVLSQSRNENLNKYALLVRINVTDTTKKILIQNEEITDFNYFASPIYSHDGKNILYNKVLMTNKFGKVTHIEIWVMSSDGTNHQRLTTDYVDGSPIWLPNSEKIIFSRQSLISEERGKGSIGMFMINSDGSGLQQILSEGSVSPCWRP